MNNNLATIAKAFRHNTGKHFLDSGDFYGRHYDKPPITDETPLVSIDIWGLMLVPQSTLLAFWLKPVKSILIFRSNSMNGFNWKRILI
jgi:hypothetical protein